MNQPDPGPDTRCSAKSSRPLSFLRVLGRLLARTAGLALIVVLAAVAYLCWFGLPDWLVTDFVRAVDTGPFALEISRARLCLPADIELTDVRLYEKGVVGLPTVEAGRVTLTLDPVHISRGGVGLRRVQIEHGALRPRLDGGPARTPRASVVAGKLRTRLELRDCQVLGITLETFATDLAITDTGLRLDDIDAVLSRGDWYGPVRGRLRWRNHARVLDGSLRTDFDPHLVLPVLEATRQTTASRVVKMFNFRGAPPRCEAHFSRRCTEDYDFKLNGRFWLEDCEYRGVDVIRADGRMVADVCATNSTLVIDPLLAVRQQGVVEAGFTIDNTKGTVNFEGVSTIDSAALIKLIGLRLGGVQKTVQLRGATTVTASGVASMRGIERSDLSARIVASDARVGPFTADTCSFVLRLQGRTNTLSEVRAGLYGGEGKGSAVFLLPDGEGTNVRYRIDAVVDNVDFAGVAGVLPNRGPVDYDGRLSGKVKISGLVGNGCGATAVGEGSLKVVDGRLFRMPVFGGLSDMMARVIPGLDFVMRQTEASAEFTIADGKVRSDQVRIEGDVLSLTGRGSYGFDNRLDFDVQLTLMKEHTLVSKLLRVVTYPISKLFEFRLSGTSADPNWRPVNFSPILLEKVGLRGSVTEDAP